LKKKHASKIEEWLDDDSIVKVNYPDITADIVERIIDNNTFTKRITSVA
jgi:hypothetical protein